MKRKAINGAEQDVVTSWRRVYCYLQRAGVTAGIKRQMRRRERHQAKQDLGAFSCPECHRTSHNPNDAEHRYCGACHKFFGEAGD